MLEDRPQFIIYDNLKRRLTDMFGLSRRQRAGHLLEFGAHSLGDMRPSQLMDEMFGLLGAHRPCMLFESIFLKAMPEDIRLHIATADFTDPRALAKRPMISGRLKRDQRCSSHNPDLGETHYR